MTPYELRFEIFKQAQRYHEVEYASTNEVWQKQAETYVRAKTGTVIEPSPKPEYPTFEKILETANKINKFVSVSESNN
jgi:hypothetical protein